MANNRSGGVFREYKREARRPQPAGPQPRAIGKGRTAFEMLCLEDYAPDADWPGSGGGATTQKASSGTFLR
jgi:hypothetical protein